MGRQRFFGFVTNVHCITATLHNVGPNMADFATFIRDSVISVTDEYDVTEMTHSG